MSLFLKDELISKIENSQNNFEAVEYYLDKELKRWKRWPKSNKKD